MTLFTHVPTTITFWWLNHVEAPSSILVLFNIIQHALSLSLYSTSSWKLLLQYINHIYFNIQEEDDCPLAPAEDAPLEDRFNPFSDGMMGFFRIEWWFNQEQVLTNTLIGIQRINTGIVATPKSGGETCKHGVLTKRSWDLTKNISNAYLVVLMKEGELRVYFWGFALWQICLCGNGMAISMGADLKTGNVGHWSSHPNHRATSH